jgi:hypothetical protein
MRKIGTFTLIAVSALTIAAGFGRMTAAVPTDTIGLVREVEPGDDRDGNRSGSDDLLVATPSAEPTAAATSEPTADPTAAATADPTAAPTAAPRSKPTAEPTAEPTATATSEPGDDNGGHGEDEPGDDNGGHGEPEPGDDNGGDDGSGGHGSDD